MSWAKTAKQPPFRNVFGHEEAPVHVIVAFSMKRKSLPHGATAVRPLVDFDMKPRSREYQTVNEAVTDY